MQKVEIYTEYIKLEQFLKIADIVSTGGEAKMFLLTNEIMVNGEYENRRGRKLYKGDKVTVNSNQY
ncbi:MAG: S4 domain-containing protein YaaA, partial [Erysipelotrichaceae bacterium]|nr:S4 domain-containing protein YaaA [Erysipelotrichaceae bacterium]